MTAPIGYPEQFGSILRQQAYMPKAGQAGQAERAAPAQPTAAEKVLGDKSGQVTGPSFAEQVANFVGGVDQTQKSAEHKAEEFAVGHQNDIHGTMIAVEQAEISLHLLANVRNRVVDLYREVMRMGS